MKLEIEGKVALVTGSSSGIGLEVARSLAREGAKVYISGRSQRTVDAAIADVRATVPDANLAGLVSDNSTAEGCADTIRQLPDADILVNNLGMYSAVEFFAIGDAEWHAIMEANVMSGVRLSRHYLRGMLERGHGRIVFVSSESAVNPDPGMAHYSATKTTQLSLSRSLAELTRGTEVTVNSVLPGPTVSKGVEQLLTDVCPNMPRADAEREFMAKNRPTSLIGRMIDPKEVGDIVAFVCSARASIINGSCIRAEGGLVRNIC